MIQDEECKDLRRIEKEEFLFYSKLYSSDFSSDESDPFFFSKIQNNILHIDNCFKVLCDSDLRIEELDSVVMKMPLNKSPGTDGLTNNFFNILGRV